MMKKFSNGIHNHFILKPFHFRLKFSQYSLNWALIFFLKSLNFEGKLLKENLTSFEKYKIKKQF